MFNFGTHLKSLRQSQNITQKQLAQLINASERGIQRYELNESKPTYDILIALADFFNVSLDSLVGRTNSNNLNTAAENNPILSEKQEKLIQLFDTLDNHNQGALLERAIMLLEEQRKKKPGIYKKSV